MNRLADEKAAYLRHAAHQRIDWYPWSDEAFEKARREDKPVFLSSGAIWCHWCHVMAKECFEDDEIIKLLNENFISIKLDRDERPDIDRRYQHAVAAMGSGGGWPLSVFLTWERKPFFSGTYFPPDDSLGRPGFKRILKALSEFYREKKDEVSSYAEKLHALLKPRPTVLGDVHESMLHEAGKAILSHFDPEHGGFGTAPKFPMPGATEFLVKRSFYGKDDYAVYAVKKTLESMGKGGVYDHLGGGFHRYSTDEAWIIPHFEKMADDNAWLLRNYIDAYCAFGEEFFKAIAEGIVRFVREVLSDPDGGFYASQDADVTPDDEGGYFTWTDDDFRRVLTETEYKVLSMHFLHKKGSMHHDPSKKVLFVSMEPSQIVEKTGMELGQVLAVLKEGKEKLFRERGKREQPFVDKALYTSLNGMFITAFLKAFRVLKKRALKDFALKSLEIIKRKYLVDRELFHSEGVKAQLDDYIYFIEALTEAYEVTGERAYLSQADELMESCIGRFGDKGRGGFLDTEDIVLGTRLKGIEDIPHPSSNAVAVILLDKLSSLTGKEKYRHFALDSLRAFSLKAGELGIHAGYYYCSLDAYLHSLTLSAEVAHESELAEAALSFCRPHVNIRYGEDKGVVVPCRKGKCYEPIDTPEGLRVFLGKPLND